MGSLSTRRLCYGVSFLALSAALVAGVARAEDAKENEEGTVLTPILITGEKVARDIRKTASSVSAKSAKQIEEEQKEGRTSVSEAISDVPNVVYPDSVSAPIIRGLDTQGPNTGSTAFFAGTVPRASINVDGHYLTYNEFYFGASSIWDLESLEVFRGPQTTSQGANAIAGALLVKTKDPTFDPEVSYQGEIGSYKTRRASVAVSGPIIEDELAGRIALDYSGRDTFIDYINSGFYRAGTDQNFKSFTGRAKLLWEPSELSGFSAKLTYSYSDTNRPSQEAASAPYEDLNHITTTMPSWAQKTNVGVLDLSYDFANGVVVSNQTQLSDTKAVRTVGMVNNGDADIDQTNVSNETRVTFGDQEDVLSGVAGLYYGHTKTDEILYLTGTYGTISTFDDTKDNVGLFTEASYRLTDQWTFTGGLRYQVDRIQRDGQSVYSANSVAFDETFSALLPKASLAYEFNPEWTVGAMVSRGYNPGGVSLNLSSRNWMEFEEESIWNYEIFTRTSLLDDRLTVNANIFYMDMKNAQFNIPVEVSNNVYQSYTINAEKAHAYGMEVEANYQLLDNLVLKAGVGLLKTEIDEIDSNVAYEGNEFAKSPGYTLTLGASWDVTEALNLSGQARHIDGYYSDTANTAVYAVDPYTVVDVNATYKVREGLDVYGYVKNVFDERSPTYMQQNRGIGGTEASMTAPRMFGIGVRGTF
ncbi:TonB-dependent receptor [Rhizobium sp. CSW-27]|uniref:TonB-dependent receptor n=1 Tax=Rhizobium sp. CSW-27 TaxID=2839985 RepID=UPI001C027F58|nr:TonB-dependent receptor [Rhizobium sp. CSW-27]MBT9372938.1 TonB-dependent receptor [Rhizobium sp. CSW-27]